MNNAFGSSGPFVSVGNAQQALANFRGRNVPNAGPVADTVSYVSSRAGVGRI